MTFLPSLPFLCVCVRTFVRLLFIHRTDGVDQELEDIQGCNVMRDGRTTHRRTPAQLEARREGGRETRAYEGRPRRPTEFKNAGEALVTCAPLRLIDFSFHTLLIEPVDSISPCLVPREIPIWKKALSSSSACTTKR